MEKYLQIIFMLLMIISIGCQKSQENIEVIQKKSGKKIYIYPEKEIKLMIGNGPVLGGLWGVIVQDSSFIVNDHVSNSVVEYGFDGNYVRNIGRAGRGPGEFTSPLLFTTDKTKHIYVCDVPKINYYDMSGKFIKNINENIKMGYPSWFLIDNFDDILLLERTDGIIFLKKFSRKNLEKLYSVSLTDKRKSLMARSIQNGGFCYNSLTNRIYFIFPGEYQIREIDANTGKVLSIFGIEPPLFSPLEEKYYNMVNLPNHNPVEYRKIFNKITKINLNFFIIENKYLLGEFSQYIDGNEINTFFCYDLETKGKMDVQIDTNQRTIGGGFTVEKNKKIYSVLPISDEETEVCNGKIGIFSYKILD